MCMQLHLYLSQFFCWCFIYCFKNEVTKCVTNIFTYRGIDKSSLLVTSAIITTAFIFAILTAMEEKQTCLLDVNWLTNFLERDLFVSLLQSNFWSRYLTLWEKHLVIWFYNITTGIYFKAAVDQNLSGFNYGLVEINFKIEQLQWYQ